MAVSTRPSRSLPWTAIIDILVLFTWSLMLLRYWVTGKLSLLLHPDYQWLSNGAAILLLGLALMRTVQIFRLLGMGVGYWPQTEAHVALLPRRFSSFLLIAVAVFGFIFTPRPFSSETALQRGLGESIGQTRSQPQRFVISRTPAERTIIDWVRTLNVYPEPDAYKDQAVNVSGFVIHPPDWPDNTFMISRFVLTCCAADAYPVGLPVQVEANQNRPSQDEWLAVVGTMTTGELAGKRQVVIIPTQLEVIPEPANPYEF